ncbi:MAG: hypothetical protein HY721_23340 [Planctomycetes bacterium]|nr:hypothetical protein [Planctomycetota bacterium]
MEIDWANIRGALSRIERELAKAQEVIEATDVRNEWPEVTRKQLQAAFPDWRKAHGNDWIHDFMDKVIGRENYRSRPGSPRYRIAPKVLEALHLAPESPGRGRDQARHPRQEEESPGGRLA